FSTRTGRPGSTSRGLISPQPTDPMTDRHSGRAQLEKFLHAHELDFEEVNETTIAVVVPGEKKLTTTASFAFGDTTVTVNAFVIRHPDENDLAVYRWLLERNRRMYGLAYSIDHHGDIYLTGRFPLDAITDAELDRIFGSISEYADGAFNSLLELGFVTAIRREWQWRTKAGLPTDNLAAFAHLADPDQSGEPDRPAEPDQDH
ncbi:MAG: YbjN domain-containing protein, partial [Candidatus Nanopelagicales bacterium]